MNAMTERDAKAAVREFQQRYGKPVFDQGNSYRDFYDATYAWANSPDDDEYEGRDTPAPPQPKFAVGQVVMVRIEGGKSVPRLIDRVYQVAGHVMYFAAEDSDPINEIVARPLTPEERG